MVKSQKTAVIINPHSGGGRTIAVWRAVGDRLNRKFEKLSIFFTEKLGHATELATQVAKEGFDQLIVVGGDGTLHECVNGLFKNGKSLFKESFRVGIFNGGRGCDFVKSLGIKNDVDKMLEVCFGDKTKLVDIGLVKVNQSKDIYYLNSSTFGLGGEVARRVQTGSQILNPSTSYLVATVRSVLSGEAQKIKMSLDGTTAFDGLALNVFVCNGRYSGGGMLWSPNAKLDDGMFDILVVPEMSKLQVLSLAPRLYSGTLSEVKGIQLSVASQVHIVAAQPGILELDGETYDAQELEYQILPRALSFLVP